MSQCPPQPIDYIGQISPTPLLLLPGENDVLTPTHPAMGAYGKAREPKKLQPLPGRHFDAYDKGFEVSSAALAWFGEHLKEIVRFHRMEHKRDGVSKPRITTPADAMGA
jgi:hypothetical protein